MHIFVPRIFYFEENDILYLYIMILNMASIEKVHYDIKKWSAFRKIKWDQPTISNSKEP